MPRDPTTPITAELQDTIAHMQRAKLHYDARVVERALAEIQRLQSLLGLGTENS